MKHILIYIVIAAAVFLAPVKSTDAGKLRPIQVVMLSKESEAVIIETDTGDKGVGKSVPEALENLKATTPAIIYLDTAQFLLVTEDALDEVEQLRGVLKKNVELCIAQKGTLGEDTAAFLRVHGQLPELKTWTNGQELPILGIFGERLIFLKKSKIMLDNLERR